LKTHDERVKEAVISRLKSEKNVLGAENGNFRRYERV